MTLTDKRRWARLDAAVRRHRHAADALIEILHAAQKVFGHLTPEVLQHVARELRLPPSRVLGVATFYHLFRLAPLAAHRCLICLGTTCYIRGGPALQRAACDATRNNPNLSVGAVRCVGICGMAPLVVLDDQAIGPLTPGELQNQLEERTSHGARGTRTNR
jgi:bidirectional [NiFe] hydrogenase diaphorase subunit